MKIEAHIADHLRRRCDGERVLVVYDPELRYVKLVGNLASDKCAVINGTDSTIRGRDAAEDAFRDLASDDDRRLVIYLPVAAPRTNEDRQRNPYEAFALAGGVFPAGEDESYHSLCRQAVPDRVGAVDALFAAGTPDFETVNSLIAGSTNWPKLKTLLGAESAVEIVTAILSPTEKQEAALKADETWIPELQAFLLSTLGLKLQTKSKKRTGVASEIWRFILFSEFVFDLPVELPTALRDVPKAGGTQTTLVYQICDRLRGADAHQLLYMAAAETVAEELQLQKHMAGITQLGDRDTFAFEERIYLQVFTDAATADDYAHAEQVSRIRNSSIWVSRDGERKQLWTIADRALQLIKLAIDLEPAATALGKSAAVIMDVYCESFRQLDRLQRSFEQSITDAYGELDALEPLVTAARGAYRQTVDLVQAKFLDAIEKDGWPVSGKSAAADVFDKFVAPLMESRKKTAYFLVDALRYELAAEVQNELCGSYEVSLAAVCAQLPSVTLVGMAALLPRAAGQLRIVCDDGKLTAYLGDRKVMVPNDRFAYVQSLYGDLCQMRDLDELVSKQIKLPEKTQLLIVKTTDIDAFGEANALEALRILPQLIRKLIAGIRKVAKLGFEHAVLVTDHGFILMEELGAGNVVEKPSGDWAVEKTRCLLGKGSSGPGVRTFGTREVGITCDTEIYAVPAGMSTFSKGNPYFHGGLSLQECVLPVLSVALGKTAETAAQTAPEIQITYKGGATNQITTRRPMIEISVFKTGLFDEPIEFRLEAYSGKELVAEAGSCYNVNSATGLVSVKPGDAVKVPLRMDDTYTGTFEVRAVDPITQLNHAVLKLKTDYME
jgi:hypothetical protein